MSRRTSRSTAARSTRRSLVSSERLEDRRLFATIGDFVWSDLNANGIQDTGEPGIDNVQVQLLNQFNGVVRQTFTTGGGQYLFDGVAPGTYSVRVNAGFGRSFSPANQGADDALDSDILPPANPLGTVATTARFTIAATDVNLTVDAGIVIPVQVSGTTWNDTDADGIQDPGEPVRSGIAVTLQNPDGSTAAGSTTNAAGQYTFSVTPGRQFRLQFSTPSGQMLTRANQGEDDTIDSDADLFTGFTAVFAVPGGTTETSIDAGYVTRSTWSGQVYRDVYGDGVEPSPIFFAGLEGQVVFLDEDGDAALDPAESWTTSAGPFGGYSLPAYPGTATLVAATPGYDMTTPPEARTRAVTAGDVIAGVNVGLTPKAPNHFATPVGPEFRVNEPSVLQESRPAVASDAGGNYVVAWTTPDSVRARRFNAADEPLDQEFQVNTSPVPSFNGNPQVAVEADGDFVVIWQGSSGGIVAQRFAANGTPLGGEIAVTQSGSTGIGASIAVDPTGGFGVAWWGSGNVLARRYDADGNPKEAPRVVNDTPFSADAAGGIVFDAEGRMTVAYRSGFDVRARRFAVDGAADGPSFVVASQAGATGMATAINSAGERLFTWTTGNEVRARLYAPDNTPRGAAFRVSAASTAQSGSRDLDVAAGADGMFMAVYRSGSPFGILGQLVSPDGALHGREFRVSTTSPGFQEWPTVAPGADGTFITAFDGPAPGQFKDIFAQRVEMYVDRAEFVGDRVWDDADSDGVQDEGEAGVAGVTVEFQNEFGSFVDSAVTDASGQFRFRGMKAGGSYRLSIPRLGAGLTLSRANQGADDALDSDFDPTTRLAYFTAPAVGADDLTIDAGVSRPPLVTEVFVSGRNWDAAFKAELASAGVGDAAYGFRITSADQLNELPWTDIDQVSIRFSEDVVVAADDLAVRGVTQGEYEVKEVAYDPATFTATWRIKHGLVNDKVIVDLDADAGTGVTDVHGNPLNGEWVNPAGPNVGGTDTFPSGDNVPGGDFRFRLNVLPGDVNRDGVVDNDDESLVNDAKDATPGSGLYAVYFDVDGSALIDGGDRSRVRHRDGDTVPEIDPI